MHNLPIHQKAAPCPICKENLLTGYWFDLTWKQIEYDHYFLPRPVNSKGTEESGYIVDNLTLFNNYFCPNDLYAYTGNIVTVHGEQRYDRNIFYHFRRFFRARDYPNFMGHRVRYFLAALRRNGLHSRRLLPNSKENHNYEEIKNIIQKMISDSREEKTTPQQIYKDFIHLQNNLNWKPFKGLTKDFYKSFPVMSSLLELQLGDMLLVLRRDKNRRAKPLQYKSLYATLEDFKNQLLVGQAFDENLMGNILFQSLKMAAFYNDWRREKLLHTAFRISDYLSRINLRIGANLNQKLHILSCNPDVIFYLDIQLGRELNIENEREKALLRFLNRRLEQIMDYSILFNTQESLRIVKIGTDLKKHVKALGGVEN